MAGVNQTWDSTYESNPADGDNVGAGNEEFQNLKTSISTRLGREHNFTLAGTQTKHGWHKMGSARVFYGTSAPTDKCDASAVLDSDDTGCLWVDTTAASVNYVKFWDGNSWEAITTLGQFDTIIEKSSGTGVTIDGVKLKDSEVYTDIINEKTSATGVTIDGVLLKDNIVQVDIINEKTSAAGVTIDGLLVKDGSTRNEYSKSTYIANKVTSRSSSGTTTYNFKLKVACECNVIGTNAGDDGAYLYFYKLELGTTTTLLSITGAERVKTYKGILFPGEYRMVIYDRNTLTHSFDFQVLSAIALPAGTISISSITEDL